MTWSREILKKEVILGSQIKRLAINYALLASSYWRQFPKESLTSPIWKSLQHLVVVKASGQKKDLDTDVLLRDVPVDCPWSREVMKTVNWLQEKVSDMKIRATVLAQRKYPKINPTMRTHPVRLRSHREV
jgi:hypothetical protein